jgi:hypothetical protein
MLTILFTKAAIPLKVVNSATVSKYTGRLSGRLLADLRLAELTSGFR